MSDKTNVVNLKDLYDLARGNNTFIVEMIDIFLEQNPADLEKMRLAIDKNDFGTVKAMAHKMKTSVGFMGMKPLLEPLTEMETMAEEAGKMPEITTLYKRIKGDCEMAIKELQEVLIKIKSGIR